MAELVQFVCRGFLTVHTKVTEPLQDKDVQLM